jgi:hypothetical protein
LSGFSCGSGSSCAASTRGDAVFDATHLPSTQSKPDRHAGSHSSDALALVANEEAIAMIAHTNHFVFMFRTQSNARALACALRVSRSRRCLGVCRALHQRSIHAHRTDEDLAIRAQNSLKTHGTCFAVDRSIMHKLASALIASGLFLCTSGAFADDAPEVVSSRVRSYESEEKLTGITCDLVAAAQIGGQARLFDIAVSGKRCSSLAAQSDAIPMRVRFEPRSDGWRDVVFEADPMEGTSSSELRTAVDGVARELFRKLGEKPRVEPRAVPSVVETTEAAPSEHRSGNGMRGGGVALMSVGGAGLGIAAITGVVALMAAGVHTLCLGFCGSQDLSGFGIAAGVSAGVGATFMILGGVLLSVAPPKSNISAQLGPTGGSLRVTF